jgi:hypothetical protein
MSAGYAVAPAVLGPDAQVPREQLGFGDQFAGGRGGTAVSSNFNLSYYWSDADAYSLVDEFNPKSGFAHPGDPPKFTVLFPEREEDDSSF